MELLCTYEEWLEKRGKFQSMTEKTARGLELSFKLGRTEEEQKELDRIIKEDNQFLEDMKFTELTHKITDMCLNPKSNEIDFEEIGRMQFDLERMKYPVVVPKAK